MSSPSSRMLLSSTAVARAPYTAVLESEPVESAEPSRRGQVMWIALLTTLISALYVAWHLGRGWMPFDDGALAQAAERVLQGELPHRDFDDIYTGGLAILNAGAFRLLGITLWSMRVVLFAVFIAWVPAVFYLASRFVRPLAAAGVTLLAVAWSLPNYTAAMPSWYNLFLATFGVAGLCRYIEDGRRRWLVVAGVAGGLSFLVKVVGLYYVAGVLLFLVFQAHAVSRAAEGAKGRRSPAYSAFVSAALLVFVVALAGLVRRQLHAAEVVQFVLPGALIVALLVRNEWTLPAGDSQSRFATLARLITPFLAGVVLPIALFLVPYARSGALGAFVSGVFILPTKRFGIATVVAPSLYTLLALVPIAILLVASRRMRAPLRHWGTAVAAVVVALLIVATGHNNTFYRGVWQSTRTLLPVLAVAGVLVLSRARAADANDPLLRSRVMLVLSVAAVCNLVQFPYAVPNYLCYVAPLVILTMAALSPYMPPLAPVVPASLLAFYLAFAVLRMNDTPLYGMGTVYWKYWPTRRLANTRAGIEIPLDHAMMYEYVIPLLRSRARGGYTWASPDAPEIYFLSGLRNPTRTLFDFFDDPTDRSARVLRAIEAHGVTAIALNRRPAFSEPIPDDLVNELERRFPFAANVGPTQVRWRR
jgi:hypothetical protein